MAEALQWRTVADGLAVLAALHASAFPARGLGIAVADVGVVVSDVAAHDAELAAVARGGDAGCRQQRGDSGHLEIHLQHTFPVQRLCTEVRREVLT